MQHVHPAALLGLAHIDLGCLASNGEAREQAGASESSEQGADRPERGVEVDGDQAGDEERRRPAKEEARAHSGGLGLARLQAQDVPRHIRAQVLAADSAAGGTLDQGALFGRDTAYTARPLPDKLRRATDRSSDGGLPSVGLFHVFRERHASYLKRRASLNQAGRLLPHLSVAFGIEGMKTIGEIRRANLELLVAEHGTLDAVAGLGGTSSVYLSQVRKQALDKETGRPREMGTRIARRLEAGAGKEPGWMDIDNAPIEFGTDLTAHVSSSPPHVIVTTRRDLTEDEISLLEDFSMLPDDERAALRSTLKAKADHVRKIVNEYLGKRGISATPVPDSRVEETYGAPPPPPAGPAGYKKITPIPEAPHPARKVKGQ